MFAWIFYVAFKKGEGGGGVVKCCAVSGNQISQWLNSYLHWPLYTAVYSYFYNPFIRIHKCLFYTICPFILFSHFLLLSFWFPVYNNFLFSKKKTKIFFIKLSALYHTCILWYHSYKRRMERQGDILVIWFFTLDSGWWFVRSDVCLRAASHYTISVVRRIRSDAICHDGSSQVIVANDWHRDPCDAPSHTTRLISHDCV